MKGWRTAAAAATVWPAWRWYALRVSGDPEEAAGVAALTIAVWAGLHSPARDRRSEGWLPALLLTAYALSYHTLPPIGRAALAVMAVAATAWEGRRVPAAAWGLLLLALPVRASLEFYLGFPLRLVASQVAAGLLRTGGAAVTADGTRLAWAASTVEVDAPCAGVRMLWTAMVVALAACAAARTGWKPTAGAVAAATAAVVAGNAIRAAALFYLEAGIITAPHWAHEGIGLLVFAATVLAALGVAPARRPPCAA